jgi:hypothetical protein
MTKYCVVLAVPNNHPFAKPTKEPFVIQDKESIVHFSVDSVGASKWLQRADYWYRDCRTKNSVYLPLAETITDVRLLERALHRELNKLNVEIEDLTSVQIDYFDSSGTPMTQMEVFLPRGLYWANDGLHEELPVQLELYPQMEHKDFPNVFGGFTDNENPNFVKWSETKQILPPSAMLVAVGPAWLLISKDQNDETSEAWTIRFNEWLKLQTTTLYPEDYTLIQTTYWD